MKQTSKSIKIASIVGARPQFIKAAAITRAITEYNERMKSVTIEEKIIHTGQHYDDNLSKVFFDELEIPRPDYNLEVGSGSHGEQTGLMLQRLESVLLEERPDFCLVYGDTNTTLAGTLAASKLHIPVAHIEAGLRSFNRVMPEEINRVVSDHISDYLFCPTETAVTNLKNEGITKGVFLVGDVMYDCSIFYANKSKSIEQKVLQTFSITQSSYYLATVHRAENTDNRDRLEQVVKGLNEIGTSECPVILPLHPRTEKNIHQHDLQFKSDVRIIKPVSYLEMVVLEKHAKAILTDSGGVQKEAYFYRVPCVTLRDETEWIETVQSGWNTLAGADSKKIVQQVSAAKKPLSKTEEPSYGKGDAANRICEELLE